MRSERSFAVVATDSISTYSFFNGAIQHPILQGWDVVYTGGPPASCCSHSTLKREINNSSKELQQQ